MTCCTENTPFEQVMELLIENGFNGVADTIGIMMNAAMKIERARFLQADPYELNGQHQGYANCYKPKTVKTRVGEVQLSVPQTRNSAFYLNSLER